MRLRSECLDDFFRALDPDTRPQDRKIKSGFAVFGKPLATPRHWPQEADRVEQIIAQSLATGSLFRLGRLGGEAARPHQPLEERQPSKETKVGAGSTAQRVDVVTDVGRQTERQFEFAAPSRFC